MVISWESGVMRTFCTQMVLYPPRPVRLLGRGGCRHPIMLSPPPPRPDVF